MARRKKEPEGMDIFVGMVNILVDIILSMIDGFIILIKGIGKVIIRIVNHFTRKQQIKKEIQKIEEKNKSNNIEPKEPVEKQKLYKKLDRNIKKKDIEKLTKEEIISEIQKVIKTIIRLNNNVNDYIAERVPYFEVKDYFTYQDKKDKYNKKMKLIEERITKKITKDELLKQYNQILYIYKAVNGLHKEFLDKEDLNKDVSEEKLKYHEYFRSLSHEEQVKETQKQYIAMMEEFEKAQKAMKGLSNTLEQTTNTIEQTEKNHNSTIEEDNYTSHTNDDIVYDSLEDWQKKEVDEGNYDSTSFEEEDLEEDDYYYEDDD